MFAAIDWDVVLTTAQEGAIIGAVLGCAAGVIAVFIHKLNGEKESETDPLERNPTRGGSTTDKTVPRSLLFLLIAVIAFVNGFVADRFVGPAPAGGDRGESEAASRHKKPSVTVLDYGRYRDRAPVRVMTDRNNADSVGVVGNGELTLLEQTDRVPCKVGETWGFRIRVVDVPANRPYTVRKEVHHPPIRKPDGSVTTKSVGEVRMRAGEAPASFHGWYFLKGYEYELAAGEWTIVVFIDDIEMTRRAFTIR